MTTTEFDTPVSAELYVSPKYRSSEDKRVHIAYILLIFFGLIGVHKFYLGKAGMGILYIFTVGLFGIGVLIDIFTLNEQTINTNKKLAILR